MLIFDKSRTFSLITLNSFLASLIAALTSLAKLELYTLIFNCLEILLLSLDVIVNVTSPRLRPVIFKPLIETILSLSAVIVTFLFVVLIGVNVTLILATSFISIIFLLIYTSKLLIVTGLIVSPLIVIVLVILPST